MRYKHYAGSGLRLVLSRPPPPPPNHNRQHRHGGSISLFAIALLSLPREFLMALLMVSCCDHTLSLGAMCDLGQALLPHPEHGSLWHLDTAPAISSGVAIPPCQLPFRPALTLALFGAASATEPQKVGRRKKKVPNILETAKHITPKPFTNQNSPPTRDGPSQRLGAPCCV